MEELFPLSASVHVNMHSVCGCWLRSVRQGWKHYTSGNSFTVCMGNCCDLFGLTVQIFNCEREWTGMSERVMTTNGSMRNDQKGWKRKSVNTRKFDLWSLMINFPPSSEDIPSSEFRVGDVFLHFSLVHSVNPSM